VATFKRRAPADDRRQSSPAPPTARECTGTGSRGSQRNRSAATKKMNNWPALILIGLAALASLAPTARGELRAVRSTDGEANQRLFQITIPSLAKRSRRVRLCGQQLVESLRLVCRRVRSMRGKRSADYQDALFAGGYYRPNGYAENAGVMEVGLNGDHNLVALSPAIATSRGLMDPYEEDDGFYTANDGAALRRFRSVATIKVSDFIPIVSITLLFLQSVRKRGLSEECCSSSCTMARLQTYC